MRKIFESKFHSRQGREFRVEVYDNESSVLAWSWSENDPQILDFQEGGLDISWELSEDDVYQPIVPSTLKTNLIIRTREHKRFLANLRQCDDFQFLIKVYAQKGNSFEPYWFGALTPSAVEYEHGVDPRTCSLTWTDGINVLKERRFEDENGDIIRNGRELRRHIGYCLNQLPTIGLYPSGTIMDTMCDLYHEDMDYNGQIKDPLRYTLLRTDRYYSSVTADNSLGKGFFVKNGHISCYDVLRQIMLAFNLRFFHGRGRYNAVSPTFALNAVVAGAIDPQVFRLSRFRYDVPLVIAGATDSTFGDSTAITQATAANEPFDIDLDATYHVASGSMESMRHPIHQAMITHTEGGSQLIFPAVDRVYINQNWYSGTSHSGQPPSGQYDILPLGFNINTLASVASYGIVQGSYYPNQIFEEFYSGESAMFGPLDTTDINGSASDTAPIVVTGGNGFRIKGVIRGAFPSPRNLDGSSSNPVLRKNKMLGAKPIVRMKFRVGSYYLKQDLQPLNASHFTGDLVPNDWGEIHIGAFQTGVPAQNLQYYPVIPAADATWTQENTDTFDFHFIQNGRTRKQNIQGDYEPIACPTLIKEAYDTDGNIQEIEYIGGLWTQNKDGEDTNELEYNGQSRQLWGEDASSVPYRLARLETEFDLLVPPLPDDALDQEGVEIEFSVYAYDANNDLLSDHTLTIDGTTGDPSPSNNAGAGDVWGGFTPYIKDLKVFLGGGEVESDIIYTASVPDHSDVIDIGSTVVGGSPTGISGNNSGIQIQIPPIGDGVNTQNTYTTRQEWKSQTYGELGRTDQQLLQRTVQSYTQMYGEVRPVLALDLFEKPDRPIDIIDIGKRFRYKYYNVETDVASTIHMCCVGLSHNLHDGLIRFRGLVTDSTRFNLITEAEDPKGPADFVGGTGGGGGGIGEVFGGVKSKLRVSDVTPAQQTKLDFINLNATNTGVDTITGFSGAGLTQEQIDKLAAIILDANGGIQDFTVASGRQPLSSDEVNDANNAHKFATQAELNAIAANTTSVNDILTVFKETTTGDGAGVYINTASTTESHVSVTSTSGKLQAGENTKIELTETSPGSLSLIVQAGATGSEAPLTALSISGSSTTNKATMSLGGGDVRIPSPTQFSSTVNYTAASQVNFLGTTSGISHDDLDDKPPFYHGVLLDGAGGGGLIGSGSIAFAVNDLLANTGSGLEGVWMCNTAVTINQDASESGALTNFNAELSKFTKVAAPGDLTLADLDPSSPADTFSDTLTSFSLTTSGGLTLTGSAGIILIGTVTNIGALTSTGAVTGASLSTTGTTTSGDVNLYTNGGELHIGGNKYAFRYHTGSALTSYGVYFNANNADIETLNSAGSPVHAVNANSGRVRINNTYNLPTSDGTNGQVLTTDGSGNVSFQTVSGGGGGGMTETPLIQVGGRWMWSSTDSGERVLTGSTAYGPTNWYSHSSEPNGILNYSASDTVDTTTASMSGFYITGSCHHLPSDSKRIRVKFSQRNQNAANQTFGWSVWHCATLPSGTFTGTVRLIAKSADITGNSSSTYLHHGEFTSTTAYSGGAILLVAEHRAGTLSTTTYVYGNCSIFLV